MSTVITHLLGTASQLLADVAKLIGTPFDGAVQKSVVEEVSAIFDCVKGLCDKLPQEDLARLIGTPLDGAVQAALFSAAEELKKQHDRIKFHDFGTVDPPVPADPPVPTDPAEPGVGTQGWG